MLIDKTISKMPWQFLKCCSFLSEGCTHRLVVVTVACRPHKWWFVFEGGSLKDWLGLDSKQEVWSPARGSIRLEHTEEATVSITFIPPSELLMAPLKACISCCLQRGDTCKPLFQFVFGVSKLQASYRSVLSHVDKGLSSSWTVHDTPTHQCCCIIVSDYMEHNMLPQYERLSST